MFKNGKKYPWNKIKNDNGADNDVYAGPEYYEKPPRPMEGVYAGPKAPDPMMMCVYAGPDFFAGRDSTQGAYLQKQEPVVTTPVEISGDAVICAACGGVNAPGTRFCCECGMPFETEEG